MTVGFKGIIAQLEDQKAAIDRALAALREVEGHEAEPAAKNPVKRRVGRPSKKNAATTAPASKKASTPKGGITPEGRKLLADAMKRRWAIKRAGSSAKPATAKPAAKKGVKKASS